MNAELSSSDVSRKGKDLVRMRAGGDMGREQRDEKDTLPQIFLALWLYRKSASKGRGERNFEPMAETRLPLDKGMPAVVSQLVETSILLCQMKSVLLFLTSFQHVFLDRSTLGCQCI